MQAYMQLRIKPIGVRRIDIETERKKRNRFGGLSRFLRKSASYYLDEDLRRMGSPYRWTQ